MLPPSRGKRNCGALAPSASATESAIFGFESGGVLLVAVVLAASDFKGFDAALCDDPELALLTDFLTDFPTVFLADLLAAERRFVPPFVFSAAKDWPPAVLPGDGLEDFLRDFVDIAFLSSLSADQPLGYCGSCPARRNRAGGCASLTAPEYGYKKFDASPVARWMNVRP
jgi:hypothetical protein